MFLLWFLTGILMPNVSFDCSSLHKVRIIIKVCLSKESNGGMQMSDNEVFQKAIEELKSELGDGVVTTDIWHSKGEAKSLAGDNLQPRMIVLFNEVTRVLEKILQGSNVPGLGSYYLVQLENDHVVVIVVFGEYQQLMLVDLTKTTMGVLISVALPKVLESLNEVMPG